MSQASVLAIDPGCAQSAIVSLREDGRVAWHQVLPNWKLASVLRDWNSAWELEEVVAIEMISSYGMPVGREVFETVLWIGRFVEIIETQRARIAHLIYRKDVKLAICRDSRAKDANIRHALIDLYGGSKEAAIGRKKTPGPLYGIKGDEWAALGVAVTRMRLIHGESWAPKLVTEAQP